MSMPTWPNKITGANAGGPRQLPIRTRWAGRVAQFGVRHLRRLCPILTSTRSPRFTGRLMLYFCETGTRLEWHTHRKLRMSIADMFVVLTMLQFRLDHHKQLQNI